MSDSTGSTLLGQQVAQPQSPDQAVLETVPNPAFPRPGVKTLGTGWEGPGFAKYVARFVCPEFTSLCPKTGQPDFAHLVIDYAPNEKLIESKSLKLFLNSFRNHGAFHEECSLMVARRIEAAADPFWIRLCAYWYPRGGIPIEVFYQNGLLPKNLYVPDPGVPPYRGR